MFTKTDRNISFSPDESQGFFGETDRSSGEYHFRDGSTQEIYANAHYIAAEESTETPKYYKPSHISEESAEKRKIGAGFLAVMVLCVLCALLGGLVGAMLMSSTIDDRLDLVENNLRSVSLEEESRSLTAAPVMAATAVMAENDIFDNASTQVVSVNTQYSYQDRNGITIPGSVSGSGFAIDNDGHIITNYHVVQKALENNYPVSAIMYDGTEYYAEIIGVDYAADIAVLYVSGAPLQAASVGNSDNLRVGDKVYAVGNPYGILDFSMTSGMVSALDRMIATEGNENPIGMFQIDAAVYEGNSGGPVYNEYGQVVGVVSAKYSTDVDMKGIGFAIPINYVMNSISGIVERDFDSNDADIGISFYDQYNPVMASLYDMHSGAYVLSVGRGSCAEVAGITEGDVIVQIDSSEIRDDNDVQTVLRQFRAGDTVTVMFYRGNDLLSVYVTLDRYNP